jgi:hypothetical protein
MSSKVGTDIVSLRGLVRRDYVGTFNVLYHAILHGKLHLLHVVSALRFQSIQYLDHGLC